MDITDLNSPRSQDYEPDGSPAPGASEKTKDGSDLVKSTIKGVENAKKKLRAFSIQKKAPLSPVPQPKPLSCGSSTVFIGKFMSSKPPLKPGGIEDVLDPKKPPKPPKPGTTKFPNADYLNLQKKTLSEIEDMKRKMELVELGIPLGLICPTPDSDKAMPTKAMPPIKSLLDPAKVDEIIREAKKAKAEGKSFKFSYQKQLPSYHNPFKKKDKEQPPPLVERSRQRGRRRFNEPRRYSDNKEKSKDRDYHRDEKHRDKRERSDRSKHRDDRKDKKSKEKDSKSKDTKRDKHESLIPLSDDDDHDVQEVLDEALQKDTDVNLKGFVVCDSWSENEDKIKETSPKSEDKNTKEDKNNLTTTPVLDAMDQLKQSLLKNAEIPKEPIEKLKPVTDSFKFEIEDDDDDALDMFSENTALNRFAKQIRKKKSGSPIRFDYESKDSSIDGMDDTFLESVIAEIKQENIDDDHNETAQDKGLVEYDASPKEDERESVTPELDDRARELYSSRSDYSDSFKSVDSVKSAESGYKSTESGYKSTYDRYRSDRDYKSESGYRSTEVGYKSPEPKILETLRPEAKMTKSTVDSLETWSFVLKICQPLLFRHDKKRCYKESRIHPKLWYAENPKNCACVKDRSVVYQELEMCKTELVDTVYASGHVQEAIYPEARGWYPANFLSESVPPPACSEWEGDDSQERPTPPPHARVLHKEYQKFMQAVWPEVDKSETPRSTPVRGAAKKKAEDEPDVRKKKMKLSSEGWSQESEVEELEKIKKRKVEKIKRKRKHSTSLSDSDKEIPSKKKKIQKKDKHKTKPNMKKRRLSKKFLKKLKDKQLKKKKRLARIEEVNDREKEKKKKDKKIKKKRLLNKQKKTQRKKKPRARSSSSSSDSESEARTKKSDKKKKKKRKQSTSESNHSEELFDVNILKNIKTERVTDDEKSKLSPVKKHREIIDVKELQNDFVSIQIKKEVEVYSPEEFDEIDSYTDEEKRVIAQIEQKKRELEECEESERVEVESGETETEIEVIEKEEQETQIMEPEPEIEQDAVIPRPLTPQIKLPDENLSQCSSQESTASAGAAVKEQPYEKDDSHLRPSSQNSNYTFHDVMQSSAHETAVPQLSEPYAKDAQIHMEAEYEQGSYEMYEQMAMEYQSDVASQRALPPACVPLGRIETVVRRHGRGRGEIKCDWRAGDPASAPAPPPPHPQPHTHSRSRWGLKPGDVNIVLTGGTEPETRKQEQEPAPAPAPAPAPPPASAPAPTPDPTPAPAVYRIESIANRTENSNSGYDEAYMDMYGASDRLQYGDCFARESANRDVETEPPAHPAHPAHPALHSSTLDDRIDLALRTTVLGDVAKTDTEIDDVPDKGILVTKSLAEVRGVKRVSFADGYKPGQDSDTEAPPLRKKKKPRRFGCRWPCPASHPDHVSLWDALPPPPPPPGSPPPPPAPTAPPLALLRHQRTQPAQPAGLPHPTQQMTKFDPSSLAGFMPPEPPPGLITF